MQISYSRAMKDPTNVHPGSFSFLGAPLKTGTIDPPWGRRGILFPEWLGASLIGAIRTKSHHCHFPANTHLDQKIRSTRAIAFVVSGALNIQCSDDAGRLHVLDFLRPGYFIDWQSDNALSSSIRYEILQPTSLMVIEQGALRDLVRMDKRMMQFLAEQQHFQQLRSIQRALMLGQYNIAQRFAFFLMNWSEHNKFQGQSAAFFELPMSRRDIANYLGCSFESVSRVLRQLQEQGWIAVHQRQIELRSPSALQHFLTAT